MAGSSSTRSTVGIASLLYHKPPAMWHIAARDAQGEVTMDRRRFLATGVKLVVVAATAHGLTACGSDGGGGGNGDGGPSGGSGGGSGGAGGSGGGPSGGGGGEADAAPPRNPAEVFTLGVASGDPR